MSLPYPLAGAEGDVRTYLRSWGYWPVSFYEHTLFLPFGLDYLREKAAPSARKWLGRR